MVEMEQEGAPEKFSVLNAFATRWPLLNFPTTLQKIYKASPDFLLQTD